MRVALNRANGDFSLTFVSGAAHVVWMTRLMGDVPIYQLGIEVGGEYHPPGIFGALSDELRPLYGPWRVRGLSEGLWASGRRCGDPRAKEWYQWTGCALSGRTRLSAEGEWGPESTGPLAQRFDPPILPWRWSAEVSHVFDWALGVGGFIRWRNGRDYYNIGFANRRRVIDYGVVLDAGGLDRIRR
jgi:hypothetical protein